MNLQLAAHTARAELPEERRLSRPPAACHLRTRTYVAGARRVCRSALWVLPQKNGDGRKIRSLRALVNLKGRGLSGSVERFRAADVQAPCVVHRRPSM